MHRVQHFHYFILSALALFAVGSLASAAGSKPAHAQTGPVQTVVEPQLDGSQFVWVVFHAVDRDGFCASRDGSVSLHPVLDMPVDFVIESGEGIIIETSDGPLTGRSADDVKTFSTMLNATSPSPVRSFPALVDGIPDECQAWVKVSQSIPGPLRVLVTVPGDDGNPVAFLADLDRRDTTTVNLSFRWTLLAWNGTQATPAEALSGTGSAAAGSDVSAEVTALYAWDASSQSWRAYFPAGATVPGANDLSMLETGQSYWVAIKGPGSVAWTMPAAQ